LSGHPGYVVLSVDELDRYQQSDESAVLLPLRRRVGFEPFGVNAWTASGPGAHVIGRHAERGGDEELYVVLRGRAAFTVGAETVDAGPGTLIHVPPNTVREAIALEPETVVLAMGAKAGEAWRSDGGDEFEIAFSLLRDGREAEARALVEETVARNPAAWQGYYNAACFEARAGHAAAALGFLQRAVDMNRSEVVRYATGDDDFAQLREHPRFSEILG
jgi:quercetin dioxygenase-like cupin family protein